MTGLRKEKLMDSAGSLKSLAATIWAKALRFPGRAPKRLRLCENLPLGEHRFVAVIEFDGQDFLLGGTSASLVLLARLGDSRCGAGAVPTAIAPGSNVSRIVDNGRYRGSEAC